MGRDWIVNTLLDLDATDGEVVAAARAANPAEMAAARRELEHRLSLAELRQHTIEGRHMREQPGTAQQLGRRHNGQRRALPSVTRGRETEPAGEFKLKGLQRPVVAFTVLGILESGGEPSGKRRPRGRATA